MVAKETLTDPGLSRAVPLQLRGRESAGLGRRLSSGRMCSGSSFSSCSGLLAAVFLSVFLAASAFSSEVAIVYTGETHSMIEPCKCPAEPLGGVARRAQEIVSLRREFGQLLVVDGGGAFAGGIYDQYVEGEELDRQRTLVALKSMALMGYDAICLGDDEFAFGSDAIGWAAETLGLKFVACNITTSDGKPFVQPFITKEVGGKLVAVVGVCTPEVAVGDYWQQFSGLRVQDPAKAVSETVRTLRHRADLIVVLAHLGEEASRQLAQQVEGLDIIFNSHRRSSTKRMFQVGQTRIINFDYQARNLILARISLEGPRRIAAFSVEDIPLAAQVGDEPKVAALVSQFRRMRDSGALRPRVRLDLYIMSYCPYGAAALAAVSGVVSQSEGFAELHPYYIVQEKQSGSASTLSISPAKLEFESLHGPAEVQEDLRRICIWHTQPERLAAYSECMRNSVAGTDWTECAEKAGVSLDSVTRCISGDFARRELFAMALRCKRLRVGASPTLFVNNVRFAEEIGRVKVARAVCNALGGLSAKLKLCQGLPKCLYDYDCPQKKGMIARCVNPGTRSAKCVYQKAVRVPLVVLYDPNSVASNEQQVIASTRAMLPGLSVERVDAASPRGSALVKSYGVERLPAYLFSEQVARAVNFEQLKPAFVKRDDKLLFRPEMCGANIVASRPRVPKRLDLFLSPVAKPGLEALLLVFDLMRRGELEYSCKIHYIVYPDGGGGLVARMGLAELEEAQRQVAIEILHPEKFGDYIRLRSKAPDSSYWEEPILAIGLDPLKLKQFACSEKVRARLLADARLCQELGIAGPAALLIENREIARVMSERMLREIIDKLAKRLKKTSAGEAQ